MHKIIPPSKNLEYYRNSDDKTKFFEINRCIEHGYNLLHLAIMEADNQSFKALLENPDIDVNTLSAYKNSGLDIALEFDNDDFSLELLKHGAQVSAKWQDDNKIFLFYILANRLSDAKAFYERNHDNINWRIYPDISILRLIAKNSDYTYMQAWLYSLANGPIQDLLHDANSWKYLASGSYHHVFIYNFQLPINNFYGYLVYKKLHCNHKEAANERNARKWREINPGIPIIELPNNQGLIMPYLGNTLANDAQVADKIIEIYRRTGNIIMDAPGNFLVFQGQVVCIDMDQSKKRGSFWGDYDALNDANYINYINKNHKSYNITNNIIKNLLYLEHHLSTVDIPLDYLNQNFIAKLTSFREHDVAITLEALQELQSKNTTLRYSSIFSKGKGNGSPTSINALSRASSYESEERELSEYDEYVMSQMEC
jgi:hypothetical protein